MGGTLSMSTYIDCLQCAKTEGGGMGGTLSMSICRQKEGEYPQPNETCFTYILVILNCEHAAKF